MTTEKLALLGGKPAIIPDEVPDELFKWPIITKEDEEAALDVIRNRKFSGYDVTSKFEEEFSAWQGRKYSIAFCNGTLSLAAAMYGIGLGAGDEIICPTKTYWASALQSMIFGATPVFCNITEMLSIDPDDIERCITPRTKAIMVVHYVGYPCEMDRIMEIANKHNLYVIEDVSQAQGGLYKGKKLGSIGHVAAMSLMAEKSLSAGEMGVMTTDDVQIYERALAYGHHILNSAENIKETDNIKPYYGVPLGGVKGRVNQVASAIARVQLKYYDERCAEIRKAMNYFWDLLEGLPGIRAIRVDESTGSNMAGWYAASAAYHPEELHGLPVSKFCEAVRAEIGKICWEGGNYCLHTHEIFKTFDLRNSGKPSRIEYTDRDVREDDDKCAPSLERWCFSVPWFKHLDKEWIERYAYGIRKVIENHEQLLGEDTDSQTASGRWFGFINK